MKTSKAIIEIEVPVVACARCGKEATCEARLVPGPIEGTAVVQATAPFPVLKLGADTVLLCPECERFLRGALVAAGVRFPRSEA